MGKKCVDQQSVLLVLISSAESFMSVLHTRVNGYSATVIKSWWHIQGYFGLLHWVTPHNDKIQKFDASLLPSFLLFLQTNNQQKNTDSRTSNFLCGQTAIASTKWNIRTYILDQIGHVGITVETGWLQCCYNKIFMSQSRIVQSQTTWTF